MDDAKRVEDLGALRRRIDAIDDEIVRLLDQRAQVVREVGALKGSQGASIFRPEREDMILERTAGLSAQFSPKAMKAVFREILSSCRALEKKTTVAYLGPAGTFTEMAVLKRFGSAVEELPCTTVPDVFDAVENGRADFGVVPRENNSQGSVMLTLDKLLTTPLLIVGEVSVPVVHNLLSLSGSLGKVQRVLAHPQALAQCRQWLSKNLPHVQQQACSSNAEAARLAAQDPSLAGIAASRAGDLYGLKVAAAGIQDSSQNRTRFLVLGQQKTHRRGGDRGDKTTFIFAVRNRAGALFEILKPLADEKVDMLHLESRPARNGLWEYNFFVDISGHVEDEPVRRALEAVRKNALVFKFLGSYPRAAD